MSILYAVLRDQNNKIHHIEVDNYTQAELEAKYRKMTLVECKRDYGEEIVGESKFDTEDYS